jgi:hypothetical protein
LAARYHLGASFGRHFRLSQFTGRERLGRSKGVNDASNRFEPAAFDDVRDEHIHGVENGNIRLILAFWFGPATAVKFGPLGQHWLGFMDGATEA